MKVLFDNCTSPQMARTLNGYISVDGHEAVHMRDLPLKHPTDLEWIEYLRQDAADWIVITADARIRRDKAERIAFRQARLKGVVLAAAYQKTPMNRCCAALIHRWDELFSVMHNISPPALLELSINFHGRFKILSLGD